MALPILREFHEALRDGGGDTSYLRGDGGWFVIPTDADAGTGSLRTLGTGATQACAGNDSRLTDARDPKAHRTTHEAGGSDPVTPIAHHTSHETGGSDLIAIPLVTNYVAGAVGAIPTVNAVSTSFYGGDGVWHDLSEWGLV